VDKALECIGNPVTIKAAHAAIRSGGRLVIVGYSDRPVDLAVNKIMFMEQDVVGSLGCRPADFPRVLDLCAAGRYRLAPLVTSRRPLEQVNEAFDELRAGKSVRSVVLPGSP
jgi:Zn-dependent alcohol dehydrogenase